MTSNIGWATKGAEVIAIEGTDITVLDGMIEAQDAIGCSITWTNLSMTVARGTFSFGVVGDTAEERVVVVDLDNASVKEAVDACLWANE